MNVERVGSIAAFALAAIVLIRTVLIAAVLPSFGIVGWHDINLLSIARSPYVLAWLLLIALFGIALALALPGLWSRLRPTAPNLTWLIIGLGAAAAVSYVVLGVFETVGMLRLSALYKGDPFSVMSRYYDFLAVDRWVGWPPIMTLTPMIFLIGCVGHKARLPGWMNILAIMQAFALIYTLVVRSPLFNGAAVLLFFNVPWYIGLAIALSRGARPDSQALPLREEQP